MADTLTVSLDPRSLVGKKVKNLRKAGIIPVHLYGQGVDSQALQCEAKTLYRLLSEAGMNTPITVTVPGQEEPKLTFIREIQWDPVRGELLHVDFLNVDVANEITTLVPISLTGDAPAVHTTPDATVVQLLREVEVRALPLDVPSEIPVGADSRAGGRDSPVQRFAA
jgi:large subunit ribosomal protein L25